VVCAVKRIASGPVPPCLSFEIALCSSWLYPAVESLVEYLEGNISHRYLLS
jgi:hypothetical protein